ncbi:peptidase S1 and S6, chymotrypsin/Hap [Enterobacter asburiae]|uniref:Peptidase S1 and S6, chymotrypsin/Hap n=1 Tax=Enterobacter asburiae TaxID=61645 RepID=A0A376F6W0_ENTAS|nr:peptidase S1 and S6, chymotrypsin/Hap [Enterobacter asburiae]
MLKTDKGWQLIGVQSSAPAAKDRWRADNRALSVTGSATSWKRWLHSKPARRPETKDRNVIRRVLS